MLNGRRNKERKEESKTKRQQRSWHWRDFVNARVEMKSTVKLTGLVKVEIAVPRRSAGGSWTRREQESPGVTGARGTWAL